jgi:hypothetical protein
MDELKDIPTDKLIEELTHRSVALILIRCHVNINTPLTDFKSKGDATWLAALYETIGRELRQKFIDKRKPWHNHDKEETEETEEND